MIQFSKIHGLGNDFIVINELNGTAVDEGRKAEFAKKFCSRKTSVGADGALFMQPSEKADFKMRIFNADGSEAETCVNGLRCVALHKFLLDGQKEGKCKIETKQGVVAATLSNLSGEKAQVRIEFLGDVKYKGKFYLDAAGKNFEYHSVDVGNPHAVVFLKEPVGGFPVEEVGHAFEFHKQFRPSRTNTEFANVVSPMHVKMRVHERGACDTPSCGSGSIAVAVAGIEIGLLKQGPWISVEQPGGVLKVKKGSSLYLQGGAERIFQGELEF